MIKNKKAILFMLFLSNINFMCQASIARRSAVSIIRRGVTVYGADVASKRVTSSTQLYRDFLTARELKALEAQNDETFKKLMKISTLNEGFTVNNEFINAFADYENDLEFSYDMKNVVNQYYEKRDRLFAYLNVPKDEIKAEFNLFGQAKRDKEIASKYFEKKATELSAPSQRKNGATMRDTAIKKITMDRLYTDFKEAQKDINKKLSSHNSNLTANYVDADFIDTKRYKFYKGNNYSSNAKTQPNFYLTLAGGYNQEGEYIGHSGAYDRFRNLVDLEAKDNPVLTEEENKTLELMAKTIPNLPQLSLKIDNLGEEGTGNADGEIEELK